MSKSTVSDTRIKNNGNKTATKQPNAPDSQAEAGADAPDADGQKFGNQVLDGFAFGVTLFITT
jgi:hypothetical protein